MFFLQKKLFNCLVKIFNLESWSVSDPTLPICLNTYMYCHDLVK